MQLGHVMTTHLWSWGSLLLPAREWAGESSCAAACRGRWRLSWEPVSSYWCTFPCPSTRRLKSYPQPEPGKVGYVLLSILRWCSVNVEPYLPDRDFLHKLYSFLHNVCWSACGQYCPCSNPHPLTPSGSKQWQSGVIERGYDRCVAERSIPTLTDV